MRETDKSMKWKFSAFLTKEFAKGFEPKMIIDSGMDHFVHGDYLSLINNSILDIMGNIEWNASEAKHPKLPIQIKSFNWGVFRASPKAFF